MGQLLALRPVEARRSNPLQAVQATQGNLSAHTQQKPLSRSLRQFHDP